jgi:hypothetical protein
VKIEEEDTVVVVIHLDVPGARSHEDYLEVEDAGPGVGVGE